METLLIFFLNRSFLNIVEKRQTAFLFRESLPFLYIILNGAQNFKGIEFFHTNSTFLFPISLRADCVNLYYFKLRLFDL